jgi:hypothetical protein
MPTLASICLSTWVFCTEVAEDCRKYASGKLIAMRSSPNIVTVTCTAHEGTTKRITIGRLRVSGVVNIRSGSEIYVEKM